MGNPVYADTYSQAHAITLSGDLSSDYSSLQSAGNGTFVGSEFATSSAEPLNLSSALSYSENNGVGRYVATIGLPAEGTTERVALEASCSNYYALYKQNVDKNTLAWNDSSYSAAKKESLLKSFYASYLLSQYVMKPGTTSSFTRRAFGWIDQDDVFLKGGLYNNLYGNQSGAEIGEDYAEAVMKEYLPSSLLKVKVLGDGVLSNSSFTEGAVVKAIKNEMYSTGNSDSISLFVSVIDFSSFFSVSTASLYSFAIGKMPSSRTGIRSLVDFNYEGYENNTYRYALKNRVSSSVENLDSTILIMKNIFLYVGLGFALFAALLLGTFIGNSVAAKKREIGILRAVGARSADVYGIFLNESIMIALINTVVASILTLVGAIVINNVFKASFYLPITALTFSIRQIGIILGVAVLTAIVASFIPSFKISSKKPIDSINDR